MQNRKKRKLMSGQTVRPKGRPRKVATDEATRVQNELKELRMQVELLQNFLYEAGRR